MNDLIISRLDSANKLLSEAVTIQQAKNIVDIAHAAEVFAKRQKLGEDAVRYATDIKIHALRKLGEMLKATERNKGAKGSTITSSGREPVKDDAPTLAELGIDKKVSMMAQRIASFTDDEVEQVARGVVTLTQVQRYAKDKERALYRNENARRVNQAESIDELIKVGGLFSTIVIDPPWDWGDEGDISQFGRADPTYKTMGIDELILLPVEKLADKDAHLYLWITNRSLPKGFELIKAWGFRYITCLTWCKPSIGMGNYFRGSSEQILFGVRGSLSLARHDVGTWFSAPRGKLHSEKPDHAYEMIESCSPGPYIDLFSRRKRDGWVSWGADV